MKTASIVFLVVALFGCTDSQKVSQIHVSTLDEFKKIYQGPLGGTSDDFCGVIYCGNSNGDHILVLQHNFSPDVVVSIPVGVLKIKGSMKFQNLKSGIPLRLLMEDSDYSELLISRPSK